MSQGSGGGGGEPEAKALHTKRLYRAVVEAVHRLDLILGNKPAYQEVFKPENISLRNKLRELCVKLMFLHPVDYGRKAEELLWRKVYYEVIQLIKTNKKHIHSHSTLECAYRTHLVAGIGFYQHLLLYVQSHYQLELQCCIDWTHVTDPLMGCKKPVSASEKEMEWAQMACHRCLVYLGDLARYQNELAGVDTELLAERFYYQALSVAPQIGMPFNQLGTLAGSKYYSVEATYCYLRCIQSEVSFEGAYGNLKRLYDKAAKMYHQLKKCETRKLSPSKKRCKDIKRLLVSFLYLQTLLQPKSSSVDSELTSLCQSVLEDFNLCLFYLPSPPNTSSANEDEEEYENGYSFLPDLLIFRMVVVCLMSVHSLKRAGSKQYSAAIAFTLALFSHLINHVNIRLQAELEEGENAVPAFQNDGTDDVSESEESLSSSKSCRNERSLQERLEILASEGLLPTVKVFLDWLRTNTDLIIMCAQSSQSLWNRLSVLLNLLPSAGDLQDSGLFLCTEVKSMLPGCDLPDPSPCLLLPEDVALRNLPPLKNAHKKFNFEQDRPALTEVEESVVRICCIRSFGHFITHLQGSILQFNSEVGIFISIAPSEQDGLLQQAQAQLRMAAEEARRNRLMRDMAQLRLQLEVSQLEGSLQQPRAQCVMSPYLVPDTQALCQHLCTIRQLAASGRFIVIIPRTVIDGLDFLKKENAGARDSIRYLEAEFKKGNRYIRCQKEVGKSFERHKLKRQDLDAWNLCKILDSCKQLTASQGGGEDDTTGMVTIITGFQLEDLSKLSAPMQSAIQAVGNANVEIKNVLEFYKQWKEMG
ncbi:protein SMG5 isoform X2 [Varanus komodoensis]|uniref:protein SMG5 isoform X2 n=1 Tax=Varanus komodoensis TaxID=61221 RepID=UPI001CF7DF05|nr:protein SMG5 isoform X2 [Varanus komodoensis]